MARHDAEHQRSLAGNDPLVPPIGVLPPTLRLFRINWMSALERSPSGAPLLSPEFVAAQGRAVRLVDVREGNEINGALGHVPGADWVPIDDVGTIADRLHRDAPVVLIARGDERAMKGAKLLEERGMRMVAAMMGGMVAWKALGFATTREQKILTRKGELRDVAAYVEEPSRHLTAEDIRHHIGDPFSVRHMKFAAMLLHGRLSCVDGRDDSGVVGTPGGDGGEFLLALAALERVTGKTLGDVEIGKLLRRRLDTFGRFYMHTDVTAGNKLIARLRADRRFDAPLAEISEAHHWRAFLTHPPPSLRPALLDVLMSDANHFGCGHVRLSINHAEEYGSRELLIETFLRMFLTARWNGAVEAEFIPLGGGHREGAVVNVVLQHGIQSFTQVPLVSPSTGRQQMFVNHPQVSGFLRKELVEFLVQQNDVVTLTPGQREGFLAEVSALGQQQLMATLKHLAAGLPIFTVTFGREREDDVAVESNGNVPS
ncbi:MAG: rhodanese-like domain-containing protein [Deltaproteobacteria bacterium]|nr:rhodanese-like domain-containing protein [Deltaproteobacteria bacterium]